MKSALVTLLLAAGAVVATAQDMPLSDVLIEGSGWELVADGFQFTDGACADAEGNFYFADVAGGTSINRIAPDGTASVYVGDMPGVSGLEFGPGGRLYACQIRTGRILEIDGAKNIRVLAEDVKPNDLVVTRSGFVYFTETPKRQITCITPTGEVKAVDVGKVTKPNGITLSADQGTLAVSDYGGMHIWAYRIEENGDLTAAAPYMTMRAPHGRDVANGDGMTTDTAGRFYVTSAVGVQMFDPTGRISGVILKPQPAKNLVSVCFAGEDLAWLYVCNADKIYRRKTKTKGVLFGSDPDIGRGG